MQQMVLLRSHTVTGSKREDRLEFVWSSKGGKNDGLKKKEPLKTTTRAACSWLFLVCT